MKKKAPFFSIIIPTYKRPKQLGLCLEALSKLTYPHDRFEVIVVDDGGMMSLDAVIASFHDKLDVTLLTQPHGGPAAGRNRGAERAKGQFLAFTDDDCAPASDWLQALATYFNQVSEQAVGGRTLNGLISNPYSAASQMVVHYLIEYQDASPNHGNFCSGNNLAVSARIFRAIGGFRTDFALGAGEDREFCDRLVYYNHRLVYAPEVIVYHFHDLTLSTFLRQHFNYGRASFQFHKARAHRYGRPMMLESKSFYLNLMQYPLSHSPNQRTLLLATLFMISQIANTAGYFKERIYAAQKSY